MTESAENWSWKESGLTLIGVSIVLTPWKCLVKSNPGKWDKTNVARKMNDSTEKLTDCFRLESNTRSDNQSGLCDHLPFFSGCSVR